ncbi:helix-turn-helix domain-containing protein [Zavarzinia compransoris]|uniref:helix-turn-helix domain-containing protein n=1 Tax=Zavarzinia marina TaxID=2911065 RepID=UPI001F1FC423|nr:helix-turn-helix transcriptional regulator [Zavarzinia marina]MCF4164993.1 helix-turn-helix domain-containing protein [Zavarzinia marina]
MTDIAGKNRGLARVGKARLPMHDKEMRNATDLAGMLDSIRDRPNGLGFETFDPAAIEIGVVLRRARETRGLTQTELADRAGLKQGQISEIESGKMPEGPSYRKLRPLLSSLGVKFVMDAPQLPAIEDWVERVGGDQALLLTDETENLEICTALIRSLIRGPILEETRAAIGRLVASRSGRANLFDRGVCGFWSAAPGQVGTLAAKRGLIVVAIAGPGTVRRASKANVSTSPQVVVAGDHAHIDVANTGDDRFDFMTVPLTVEVARSLGVPLSA